MTINKNFAWLLIICGSIAVWAAFTLTLDKIAILENPNVELPCNVNPLVSCGPIIITPQASAFGVPNPMLGIIGYSFIIMTGVVSLFGASLPRNFWKLFLAGLIFAELFIHWLFVQSVYVIGNLCLYCMITWAATWPIFVFTLSNLFPESFINKNRLAVLVGWYLLIIFLILLQFRDFFFS